MVYVEDVLILRIVLYVTILILLYVTSVDQVKIVGILERIYKTIRVRETY